MGFSFDINNNLKQSRMFLANPQKDYIGVISNAKNVKLDKLFNNMYELNFVIYEKENDEYTEYYDKIQKMRLIEVQYIGWFQIINAQEKQDENSLVTYKTVKCCMLENVLVYRKIYDITGTFALYDNLDQEHSLLHIISAECGWSISHVDNELLGLWRTFDISSMQIYNLLTTEISNSFNCVIKFDSYTKSISAYKLSNLGELTDIIISKKNILKEWVKDDTSNMVSTKIRVLGGDDGLGNSVDIRAVNFGLDYLINLDYFMNTDWVSQELVTAYNNYKTARDSANTSFNNSLATLKTKQSELTTLEIELKDLESNKSAQEQVMGASVQLHSRVPISTDIDYTTYQNAVTLFNSYIGQIVIKQSQISSKENEIKTIQDTLDSISEAIDQSNYFTSEQSDEINLFITEGEDFSDNTYIIVDTMSPDEIIDMKLELKQNAANELARISQPQYTISISASNLFTIQDDKDELISYSQFRNKFDVGNIITIKFSENYWIQARLIKMSIDFDNPSDIELTFSNKDRMDDELIQLAEVIAEAGRTASSYTLNSFGYKKASQQTSSVREFMNNALNATTNRIISDSNIQTELGQFGIINRKWLSDQNKYDDHQSWLTQNVLLFTDDNWISSKAGIGYFSTETETFYGLIADSIVGNFVLTSALTISNETNTITMNKDGAIFNNCDITITKGDNSIYLNATDGIKLTKSGVNQFYLDDDGNLTLSSNITGGSININNQFMVDSFGNGTFNGKINALGNNGTAYTFKTLIDGGQITSNELHIKPLNGITGDFSLDSAGYTFVYPGQLGIYNGSMFPFMVTEGVMNISRIDVSDEINCSIINGSMPITISNLQSEFIKFKDSITYPIAIHYHDQTDVNGLTSRLGDIEDRLYVLEHS